MSDQKEIVFTIKDGAFTMDLKNFNGDGCGLIADKFSAGNIVNQEVLKDEYHNSENSCNKTTQNA